MNKSGRTERVIQAAEPGDTLRLKTEVRFPRQTNARLREKIAREGVIVFPD